MQNSACYLSIFLFLISRLAYAGGDYWSVKVEETISAHAPQKLNFLIFEDSRGIIQGCKKITVLLEYQRVPAWSWLPFVDTSHPTKAETANAVEYLNNKFNTSSQTYFGYMGGGFSKFL